MTITFQKATKHQLPARICLAGPTGSGKTFSAVIEMAPVFGAKVVLVDTEHGSGALYADQGDYDYFRFDPPYDPARLVEVLHAADDAGYDLVIVDSLSHFWEGEGGVIDIADAAGQRAQGNSFAGWKVATPALRHLVDTLLDLQAHLIVTMRSKMEYVLETNDKGKQVPRKVGMAPVMRQGIEYEFALVADLDLDHRMVISKSRCSVLADQIVQPHRAKEMAQTFKAWLESGEPMANRQQVESITSALNSIEDPEARKAAKGVFVESFDLPDRLTASQVQEALAFAQELAGIKDTNKEGVATEGAVPAGDAGSPSDGADSHDVGQTAPEATPPGPSPGSDETDALNRLVALIDALPTKVAQKAAREEIRRTFGEWPEMTPEDVQGALEIVGRWPTGKSQAKSADTTSIAKLSVTVRQLVTYAEGNGIDQQKLKALVAFFTDTHEPRPLSEVDEFDVPSLTRLVDDAVAGKLVFETPNGTMIAREVAPV